MKRVKRVKLVKLKLLASPVTRQASHMCRGVSGMLSCGHVWTGVPVETRKGGEKRRKNKNKNKNTMYKMASDGASRSTKNHQKTERRDTTELCELRQSTQSSVEYVRTGNCFATRGPSGVPTPRPTGSCRLSDMASLPSTEHPL